VPNQLKYKLDALEWQQFELLALKCLQRDISPSIQYLEGGKDKGRDFVFEGRTKFFSSNDNVNTYLFQVKHKSNPQTFSALKRDFKTELEKVYIKHSLKYQCYCLVTNLVLSAVEYDQLIGEFSEFKKSNNIDFPERFEIYGYRQFENCLDQHKQLTLLFPHVLQTPNLIAIVEDTVNKSADNKTRAWLNTFQKNATKFIYTNTYETALESLKNANAILLSGPPKTGKTFTAEMIAFNLFLNDEFIPYPITNIDLFFEYFDPQKKQLFLFDDSIGKHNLEFYRADALNRSVDSVVQSVDKNHKFIFTSREHIFKNYLGYTDSSTLTNYVVKVNVSFSHWTPDEKESLLYRYYKLAYNEEFPYKATVFTSHKNFEPETVRAYFENNKTGFNYQEFIKHLNRPNQYLQSIFDNIDEDKKLVLLSVLLSSSGTVKDIGYTFQNILNDLKVNRLISLAVNVEILLDSIIVIRDDVHSFLHPSMFDFFVEKLANDYGIYRAILFKNVNLNLLALVSTSSNKRAPFLLETDDIPNLSIGFARILENPRATLLEINSIFAWLADPTIQLLMKSKRINEYVQLKKDFLTSLEKLNYGNIISNASIFQVIDFLRNEVLVVKKRIVDLELIKFMLNKYSGDSNIWQIVLRSSSLIDKNSLDSLVGKAWFDSFSKSLKESIDRIGRELFGSGYPDFRELKEFQESVKVDQTEAFRRFSKRQTSDYMLRTNVTWYPEYLEVKKKIAILKTCHPHGYKIHQEVIPRFEIIKRLEEYQKNRYYYKLKHQSWDMMNGHQPGFLDPDERERLDEAYEYEDRWLDEEE